MNNCMHPPKDHSHVKDNYLYCEMCKTVCNHHYSSKDSIERPITMQRKRTIFCRGGHDVEKEDIVFDKYNNISCKKHPDKVYRWKVVSVRGK